MEIPSEFTWRKTGIAAVAVATLAIPSSAHGGVFVSPIGGTPYADWTIVNYVDLDSGPGLVDYRGGNYTYNGHRAIDFTLPNFAAMDAGVSVHAAAAGTVTVAHDGEYDRWSRVDPNPGDPPNYVVIDHGDGIFTEYYHLKKDSINVGVGETVVAGQQIGEVGSSGNSSDAHLHFGVKENGNVVETYLDPARWWIDPVPYGDDVFGSLDHGVIDHGPTLTELVDRPIDHGLFQQVDGLGQLALLWTNLHGIDAGDDIDVFFYRPNGTEYAHWHWMPGQFSYGWWNASIGLPGVPDLGVWQIDFQLNGSTIVEDSFLVVTIAGDGSGDGKVDGIDYLVWASNYGDDPADDPPGSPVNGDFNNDNIVDGLDYVTWAINYGQGPNDGVAVPEPGSFALLMGGCLVMLLRRRR